MDVDDIMRQVNDIESDNQSDVMNGTLNDPFNDSDRIVKTGTIDDGTTLRGTPELGVDPDFNDSTTEHFTTNTRDLTLKRSISIKFR